MTLIPTVTIPPQTISSIQLFDLCPRQYDAKHRTKSIKFVQSYEGVWGDTAHTSLENQLKAGGNYQFPDQTHKVSGQNMREYQWIGEALLARARKLGGYVLAERKFAVGYDRDTADYWDKGGWMRGKIDVTILYPAARVAEVYDLKGLAVTTNLPTPSGWTTMGDVAVGDTLFARDGSQCRVVAKSAVKNLPCYRVLFDDRTNVVCDEEHLWGLVDGSVVCVTDLRTSDRVPVAQTIDTSEATLPIDPYLFGLWLADGKHTSGEITKPDAGVWTEVVRRGHKISHDYSAKAADDKCRVHTVFGLRTKLRLNGLLGNKHVPAAYMRGSAQQRLDLLRGLMDGDGSANVKRRQSVFTNTDKHLADVVLELALSLGQRPKMHVVNMHGFGKDVVAYVVSFSTLRRVNPFCLSRKAEKVNAMMEPLVDKHGRVWKPRDYRRVVSVEQVDSVPTQCISVDSTDHTFLCTEYFIPTHNTGKKKDDWLQLDLYSVSVMLDYGDVDTVKAGYIWGKLPPNKAIDRPKTYTRDDVPTILNTLEIKTNNIKHAWQTGVFPPSPNPLCGWCDVESCEFRKISPKRTMV